MCAKTYRIYESEVGIDNIIGRLFRQHADEQACNAFCNHGIAVRSEDHSPVDKRRAEPHSRLTAFDQIRFRFFAFADHRTRSTKLYQVVVAIQPLIEFGKFLNDLLFYFGNGAHYFLGALAAKSKQSCNVKLSGATPLGILQLVLPTAT